MLTTTELNRRYTEIRSHVDSNIEETVKLALMLLNTSFGDLIEWDNFFSLLSTTNISYNPTDKAPIAGKYDPILETDSDGNVSYERGTICIHAEEMIQRMSVTIHELAHLSGTRMRFKRGGILANSPYFSIGLSTCSTSMFQGERNHFESEDRSSFPIFNYLEKIGIDILGIALEEVATYKIETTCIKAYLKELLDTQRSLIPPAFMKEKEEAYNKIICDSRAWNRIRQLSEMFKRLDLSMNGLLVRAKFAGRSDIPSSIFEKFAGVGSWERLLRLTDTIYFISEYVPSFHAESPLDQDTIRKTAQLKNEAIKESERLIGIFDRKFNKDAKSRNELLHVADEVLMRERDVHIQL